MITNARLVRAMLLTSLVILLTAPVALADGGAKFGLRPVRFDPSRPETNSYFVYDLAPGATIEDEVLVQNSGDATGTVRLYAVDGVTGQTGGAVYLSDADPRKDVGGWVRLGEQELTLGPGEARNVRVTLTVPMDAAPGQHLGGLVAENTALKQSTGGGALQINVQTRSVVAVQVNLPGEVVEKLVVTGVSPGGQQGYQTLQLGLRNDGTEMVKPVGSLVVTDAGGNEVQRLAVKIDTILPRTEIQYPVFVEGRVLEPGTYHVAVHLTSGKNGVTDFQGVFTLTADQVHEVFQPGRPPLAPPTTLGGNVAGRVVSWPLLAGVVTGVVAAVLIALGGIVLSGRRRKPSPRRAAGGSGSARPPGDIVPDGEKRAPQVHWTRIDKA